MRKLLLATLWIAFSITTARAQMLSTNIDLAWLAVKSPNLGFELVVGERSTINLNGIMVYKPLDRDIRLYAIQPEYRYYFSGRPMYRQFIGIGAIGAAYNMTFKGKVYEGTAAGLGLTFGYVMPITRRLNVDFHAGFGAVAYKQKEYFIGDSYDSDYISGRAQQANASGYYFLPTRIGISLTYIIR